MISGWERPPRVSPMTLTADQQDAVTELVNIAFARTAAALSGLVANRVELTVPEVATHPIDELLPALQRFVRGDVATVHQVFGGPVAGDALLLFDAGGAARLVELLTGSEGESLGSAGREVLTEVGNILLGACLGVFGDLLSVRFTFTVPRMHLESLTEMLDSLTIGDAELRHALLVGARFKVRASEVTGCMVLVLGVTSLSRFLRAIEDWADQAGGSRR
jgi:chemotaxis protein CheC